MKIFAINETEWVVANTMQEALDFLCIENDDVTINEIPEEEWDVEIEAYMATDLEEFDNPEKMWVTIKSLVELAMESGIPKKIMTEI